MKKHKVEIQWTPNLKSVQSVYLQITDYMVDHISSGAWPAGSYLPSQRALAKLLKVNRSTVVAALDELRGMGLIETNGKGGTWISRNHRVNPHFLPADWQPYIEEGLHRSNTSTLQTINRHEFSTDIIRLSSGEAAKELFPSKEMAGILNEVGENMHSLGYEEPKGMLGLREEVCRYLKPYGIVASPSQVLIVSGALQAIQLITLGLLQPGSGVLLEKPSYLYSLNMFQSVGIRRYGVNLDHEGIRTEEIAKIKPKHRTSILYTIPCFHNPTGVVMSESRRRDLVEVCGREQIPIVEDDVYRELWIDETPPEPLKSLDSSGTVLYAGSVSKTLSPGLRIGWLVGPEAVVDRLSDIKMQTDYGSSSLAQLVVEKWLSSGRYAEHNAKLRLSLAERRNTAIDALNRYFKDFAEWDVPKGGYYVWIRFFEPIHMGQLFDEAFKQGILIYPGFLYDSSMNHCLRLSYSYASLADLYKGIFKLSEIAKTLLMAARKASK